MQHTIRTATNRDIPAIQEVVFSVLAEYGLQADPEGTDADLADIERDYLQRGGAFDVVEDASGQIVGTAGLYPLDAQRAELRKMYLQPSARGQGLGKQLLERILAKAECLGFAEVRLETNSVLKEAVQLYQKYGFTPAEAEHLSPRCDQVYSLQLPVRFPRHSKVKPPVGVPRRFGIGTLLVVTVAYALLFALLKTLQIPVIPFATIVGFVTLIGLGQAVLFRGQQPRRASYLTGAGIWLLLSLVFRWSLLTPGAAVGILVEAIAFGGMFGYVAGCLIAGVFLVFHGKAKDN